MQLQIGIEDAFSRVAASTGRPTVVVLDRGIMDPKAYMGADTWNDVLGHNGWSDGALVSRYDMVLHLVTAADGAEKFYTTSNNAVRTETPEQARALDAKMIDVWGGHSRHVIVRNKGGFKEKLEEATAAVERMTREVPASQTVTAKELRG